MWVIDPHVGRTRVGHTIHGRGLGSAGAYPQDVDNLILADTNKAWNIIDNPILQRSRYIEGLEYYRKSYLTSS